MSTTKEDIRDWLQRGLDRGATHVIIRCDTFDWSDYPEWAFDESDARHKADNPGDMQKTMEVYKLSDDWDEQLNLRRCHRF